jgi:hypothetical protein
MPRVCNVFHTRVLRSALTISLSVIRTAIGVARRREMAPLWLGGVASRDGYTKSRQGDAHTLRLRHPAHFALPTRDRSAPPIPSSALTQGGQYPGHRAVPWFVRGLNRGRSGRRPRTSMRTSVQGALI